LDGGNGTAREMQRRLKEAGKLTDANQKGCVEFMNSRDTKEERELCQYLLKC
jgi:glutamate racemase